MKNKFTALLEVVEDIVYFIVAVLLVISALFLVINEFVTLPHLFAEENQINYLIEIISKTLLLIMILEILYTVRITIKDKVLCSEPFLIVGMIAAIRRILIISVETAYYPDKINTYMLEIGVLSSMILIFVISIFLLRKQK